MDRRRSIQLAYDCQRLNPSRMVVCGLQCAAAAVRHLTLGVPLFCLVRTIAENLPAGPGAHANSSGPRCRAQLSIDHATTLRDTILCSWLQLRRPHGKQPGIRKSDDRILPVLNDRIRGVVAHRESVAARSDDSQADDGAVERLAGIWHASERIYPGL